MPQLQDVAMAPNQLVTFMDYFSHICQRSQLANLSDSLQLIAMLTTVA
ncbi:MAG: hypothetical protein AAF282_22460 [Cyanobacteria bacterium P01_A01_bin.15]